MLMLAATDPAIFGFAPTSPWPRCETVEGFGLCHKDSPHHHMSEAVMEHCPETCTVCPARGTPEGDECRGDRGKHLANMANDLGKALPHHLAQPIIEACQGENASDMHCCVGSEAVPTEREYTGGRRGLLDGCKMPECAAYLVEIDKLGDGTPYPHYHAKLTCDPGTGSGTGFKDISDGTIPGDHFKYYDYVVIANCPLGTKLRLPDEDGDGQELKLEVRRHPQGQPLTCVEEWAKDWYEENFPTQKDHIQALVDHNEKHWIDQLEDLRVDQVGLCGRRDQLPPNQLSAEDPNAGQWAGADWGTYEASGIWLVSDLKKDVSLEDVELSNCKP